ncbi:hypothetical protein YC2023_066236 [Brassica napus]
MSTTGRERHSVLRIFKGRRVCTGHHATCGALQTAGPYLRLSRFQGGQAICTDGQSTRAHALGFAATAAPSYSSRPGSCPNGRRVVGHGNPASGSSRIASSAYQKCPTRTSRFRGMAQQSSHPVLPILSLRIGRGHCVHDASNHWLYPIELYKCGPPLEFSHALPRSGIVHHLSGPDRHAHTRTLLRRSRSVGCAPVRDPANQLPCALRVYSPIDSHTCQTPWSVFQDGSNGEPTGRCHEHADAEAHREAHAADHD